MHVAPRKDQRSASENDRRSLLDRMSIHSEETWRENSIYKANKQQSDRIFMGINHRYPEFYMILQSTSELVSS